MFRRWKPRADRRSILTPTRRRIDRRQGLKTRRAAVTIIRLYGLQRSRLALTAAGRIIACRRINRPRPLTPRRMPGSRRHRPTADGRTSSPLGKSTETAATASSRHRRRAAARRTGRADAARSAEDAADRQAARPARPVDLQARFAGGVSGLGRIGGRRAVVVLLRPARGVRQS